MKRAWVAAPFVLLAGLSFASHWFDRSHWLGNAWAISFVACLLLVPVLARVKLWLGYAGLFYPFIVLALHVGLDWGSLSIGIG